MGNPFSTPTCFERRGRPTSIECAFLPGRYKIDRMPIRNSPPDPLVFRSDVGALRDQGHATLWRNWGPIGKSSKGLRRKEFYAQLGKRNPYEDW